MRGGENAEINPSQPASRPHGRLDSSRFNRPSSTWGQPGSSSSALNGAMEPPCGTSLVSTTLGENTRFPIFSSMRFRRSVCSPGGRLVFEVLLPVGLWLPRTRWFTLGVAVLFHLSLEYTLNLFLFHWLMLLGLLPFLATFGKHREHVLRAENSRVMKAGDRT